LFAGGSTGVPQGPTPVAGIAGPSGGKNAVSQNLDSPHSGLRSTITKGDTLSRMTGNYGKGHNALGGMGGHSKAPNAPSARQANPALSQLRGGLGQMRRIRGGLGPGKVGQAGPSNDYSMSSPDAE
jgi:hypothetical protein